MDFLRKHVYNRRSGGKYDILSNRIFCKRSHLRYACVK